ncbi:MAG: UDP-N-acetylmuramate dehydrogenase [Betaproteobacteria bacterium]|nr:UDP-N-acetylmuramate dehydrogenase [Betaproteobacteria bacterium]
MNMHDRPPQNSLPAHTALRGDLRLDEPMARHVSWRAGGRAKRFYQPADLADLQVFLPTLAADEPILFVGLGSNLLVRGDATRGGFEGTVILTAPALSGLALGDDPKTVQVGAGVASPHLAKFAARHHLAGAEWLAGVPGTVGGALAMNAGCYGTETWQQVESTTTIDRRGLLHTRRAADFEIAYRHVMAKAAQDEWFVSALFRFTPGDAATAQQRIKELLAKRMAAQPLDKPNAGSTFRNPPGDHAARLIEACGLKGYTIGGAQVSLKHANFIINLGDACAADIEALIAHMQATVAAQTGVQLVPEVRIVGRAA